MNSEISIYPNTERNLKVDMHLEEETGGLSRGQRATLFGKAKSTINKPIRNIYEEQELEETFTRKKFGNSGFHHKAPTILRGKRSVSKDGLERDLSHLNFQLFCVGCRPFRCSAP